MARIQPQGYAGLDRRNKFAANAHAILVASQVTNLATGKPLTLAGSGYLKQGFPIGQAWSFRKNFYVETEILPAIGTASFVEYWFGYPSADLFASGSGGQDPGFLTGSNTNQLGIFGSKGSRYGNSDGTQNQWGMLNNWDSELDTSGEVLTPGVLTLLVGVRRQTGVELWRNGRLIRFIAHASPSSKPASSLICGSFIRDASYWPSSSNTLAAGRVPTPVEPTADELKQFSTNVWQLFAAPHEDDELVVSAPAPGLTLTPITAALSMAGFTATISQARAIAPAAASLTLAGNTPTITQPRTLALSGAALTLTGFTPTVSQAMPQTISPAGAALSLAGGAPTVMQGAQAPPPAGGGGGGSVRVTRAFADLLDRARKPTRSQKKARRQQLEVEALELLPDLPEAEKLAPIAARIVFEQEARALAPLYADRPIQALAPVIVPFDAHAALRDLVARLVAEAELQHVHDADDESDIELLLLGS